MPEIGEIRKDVPNRNHSYYYIWTPCPICGKCRWVQRGNEKRSRLCRECYLKERIKNMPSGENHPSWRGGTWKHEGYTLIKLPKNSYFYPMTAKNGSIPEHRLVMAKHLGRYLLKSEQVHHIDGDKSNNRIENLELISPANHSLYKQMCKNCPLRREIRMLKKELLDARQRLI
jgi:hypothetical protein